MPELPEVETIANDLDAYLRRRVISDIQLIDKSKVLHTPLARFKKSIVGKPIRKVFRRAKMLLIDLGDSLVVFHLKMTGQLIYVSRNKVIAGGHPIQSTGIQVPNKFTRLIFKFKDGGILYFNDLRKFGWVKTVSVDDYQKMHEAAGQEPLESSFTYEKFCALIRRRKKSAIKAVLLDQKLVVGLGNIYVDEVLFRAGVRPTRRVDSLKTAEIKKIFLSIPIILRKSIKERGTTFSNFLDPKGLRGNFVSHLKVYGRQQKDCKRCGAPIQKTRVAGRGTHWCKNCQV